MYRWVDHTSELELEIEAPTAEDVFGEALTAIAELLSPEPPQGDHTERAIELSSGDRAALLADWLMELVYLAESEGLVPEAASAMALEGSSLRAVVTGRIGQPRQLVKAVTYHRLELEEREGGFHGRVVLDV